MSKRKGHGIEVKEIKEIGITREESITHTTSKQSKTCNASGGIIARIS